MACHGAVIVSSLVPSHRLPAMAWRAAPEPEAAEADSVSLQPASSLGERLAALGVRLSEDGSQVRARRQLPVSLRGEEDRKVLAAVHLGEGFDTLSDEPLVRALASLHEHGFAVETPGPGRMAAQHDPLALYQYVTGSNSRRLEVRFPNELRRTPVNTREDVLALDYFNGSGTDHGLTDPELARSLATLEEQGVGFRRGSGRGGALEAYRTLVRQPKEVLWTDDLCPVDVGLLRNADQVQARRREADTLAALPGAEGHREEFLKAVYYGAHQTPAAQVAPLVAELLSLEKDVELALEDLQQAEACRRPGQSIEETVAGYCAVRSELARELALESLPLTSLPVGDEAPGERAAVFCELVASEELPTPLARTCRYVEAAAQRFAPENPVEAANDLYRSLMLRSRVAEPVEVPELSIDDLDLEQLWVGDVMVPRQE